MVESAKEAVEKYIIFVSNNFCESAECGPYEQSENANSEHISRKSIVTETHMDTRTK